MQDLFVVNASESSAILSTLLLRMRNINVIARLVVLNLVIF